MKNVLKNKKGITLISLVVTIVVLIILATISVTLVLGDNGILTQAKKARDSQANAIVKENQDMDRLLAQYNSELGIAKNPYDPDDWEYAWVYDDGAWGDMLTKGEKIEGGIAAKFYKTGKKVDPDTEEILGVDLAEGDEYHLIIELIEGNGEMGTLMTIDEDEGTFNVYGWQSQMLDFMSGNATTYIGAYVTEMVVCEGITNIGDSCAGLAVTLKKVVIADTVTSIGGGAFSSCTSLTNVTIPNAVTSIGESAFELCISLTSIILGDSVTSIGIDAFRDCNSLTSITIPNGVTSIGESAFRNSESLTSITIPSSVTTIEDYIFSGCTSLTSVKLGNRVTSIGEGAFENCSSLTSISIPNSVTNIENYAFENCSSLTSITITDSVTSIGDKAFSWCLSLERVKFLTTDATKITVGEDIFDMIQEDSKIYVLSEDMKTKLEGTYDTTKTTVEVVSAERMEEL